MKQPQRASQDHRPAPALSEMAAIEWTYWRAILDSTEPPRFHPAFVPWGYYRWIDRRERSRKDLPVAIYPGANGSKWVAIGDEKPFKLRDAAAEEDFGISKFAYFDKAAISYEMYQHWQAHKAWPADQANDAIAKSEAPRERNGEPHEILRETLEELHEEARVWFASLGGRDGPGIQNQEDADKAANFASRFAEIEKEAKDARIEGRRPHLEAAEAVQLLWNPIQEDGATAKTWAKGLSTKWLAAENARKLKEAAEAAARGETVSMAGLKGAKAGTRGRAVSVQTQIEYEVTSFETLYDHYRNDVRFRMSDAVMKLLHRLALADFNDGKETPGAKFTKVAKTV